MDNITIGIEGLVGAGKTSLCRELQKLIPNSIILHGGNLYRGIIVAIKKSGIDLRQIAEKQNENLDIKKIMDMLHVNIKIENFESVVFVGNEKIDEDDLQSDEASMAVSNVAMHADNTKLYEFARKLIDELKQKFNIIISGRDLVNIYPNLDYHFFIVADLEKRIERKAIQYKNTNISMEKLKEHILERDKLQEKAGYYREYENTIEVDVTNCNSPKESAMEIYKRIRK